MRNLCVRGVGSECCKTEAFSKEEEDYMVLRCSGERQPIQTVFHLINGKNFCLRGGGGGGGGRSNGI